MEPERSLPHSQELATCTYSQPDLSRPCSHPILWRAFQYYSPVYAEIFQLVSFHEISIPKLCTYFLSPLRATCTVRLIRTDLIIWITFRHKCRTWSSSLCSLLQSPVTSSISFTSPPSLSVRDQSDVYWTVHHCDNWRIKNIGSCIIVITEE